MKKWRLMVGIDGDDYVYVSDLTWEEAKKTEEELTLREGAYSYIEEDV